MENGKECLLTHDAGIYEIRLEGQLASDYIQWFEGFQIELQIEETILKGEIVDQSALHGLLRRVRDLGVPLVSVKRIHLSTNEIKL